MMPKRQWIAALALLATVCCFALGWLLFNRTERTAPFVMTWAKDAQATATLWPSAGVRGQESRPEAIGYLSTMMSSENTDIDVAPEIMESAAEFIVDFLAARSSGDPDIYIEWAASNKLRLANTLPRPPRGLPTGMYKNAYRNLLKTEPPADLTPQAYFTDCFRYNQAASSAALRPVDLMVQPGASHAVFTTFTHYGDGFDYENDIATEFPGHEFWYGGAGNDGIRLFEPPRSLKKILAEDGEALAVRVLFVTRGPTGLNVPWDVRMILDPKHKQWFIHELLQSNIGWPTGVGPQRTAPTLY